METSNEPKTFFAAFCVDKKHIFEVNYYRLGNNKNKNFHTSASLLNYNRTDYEKCGQAQESLLNENTAAYLFYKKWYGFHCSIMDENQYNEMLVNLDELKEKYDFIESDEDIKFSEIVRLDRGSKFSK